MRSYLLNDVGRELKLTQSNEVSGNHSENGIVSGFIVQSQDILYQVVSVRILNETM
jgi:hypothetical protein